MSPKIHRPRFSLDISRPGHSPKKFTCPACHKPKKFVKFIDLETGAYLDGDYGRCDREEHCGYFLSPYKDQNANLAPAEQYRPNFPQPTQAKVSKYVPRDLVRRTLQQYDRNILFQFFRSALGPDHADAILSRYFIGTAQDGSTLFWQIDKIMQARTAAKILYNPDGHRNKSQTPTRTHTTGDGYSPCIFGEHLLYTSYTPQTTVGLVESEKTACILSAYLPTIAGRPVIWLASSGANGATEEKIQVLAGLEVILCPDFSYHARATWGLLPMRKKTNSVGIKRIDPDGDLEPDYVPLSAKLRALNCKVRFFDPAPHVKDSSDIADLLLAQGPPAPLILAPDFDSLSLSLDPYVENRPLQSSDAPISADFAKKVLPHTTTPRAFRIGRNENGAFLPISDSDVGREYLTEFLNRPIISKLIEGLEIVSGELIPDDGTAEDWAQPTDFKTRCLEAKEASRYV